MFSKLYKNKTKQHVAESMMPFCQFCFCTWCRLSFYEVAGALFWDRRPHCGERWPRIQRAARTFCSQTGKAPGRLPPPASIFPTVMKTNALALLPDRFTHTINKYSSGPVYTHYEQILNSSSWDANKEILLKKIFKCASSLPKPTLCLSTRYLRWFLPKQGRGGGGGGSPALSPSEKSGTKEQQCEVGACEGHSEQTSPDLLM